MTVIYCDKCGKKIDGGIYKKYGDDKDYCSPKCRDE
jgi:hypothetical protein